MELSTHELTLFQTIKKTAIVLILMLKLDRPLGEKELSTLLSINQSTARAWLRDLAENELITRQGRYNGYIPTLGGRQMVIPNLSTPRLSASAENSRSSAENSRSRTQFNDDESRDSESEDSVIIIDSASAENPRSSAVFKALEEEKVLYPVCVELSAKPQITLNHVVNWAAVLKKEKGEKYTPGILVYTLRSVQPGHKPPRHPEACKCGRMTEDRPFYGRICPRCNQFASQCYCHPIDCTCDDCTQTEIEH